MPSMRESLDIDPLLREFLEVRRGLTSQEIDQLLIEWNGRGSLTDFLSGKSLIDRTTAKMLITAQKGYLGSSENDLRTVLGIKHRSRKDASTAEPPPDTAPLPQTAQPQVSASDAAHSPEAIPTYRTPPTQPMATPIPTRAPAPENGSQAVPKEEQRKEDSAKEEIKDPTPVPNGTKPRKTATGRRGFLGATDEEIRHLLGSKAGPAQPGSKSGAAVAKTEPEAASFKQSETERSGSIAVAETTKRPAEQTAAPPQAKPAQTAPAASEKSDAENPSARSLPNILPLKIDLNKPDPKVGEYLGRYYLEEAVGEGATATIFRSYHKLLRIPVAIKVYKRDAMASDPIGAQRFLTEAQVLIRLEHPNIVRVLDIAVHDGAPYIVFEYVGELSLQGMIGNIGQLPPQRVAQIGSQVAAALEVASNAGLLHRDVKPDNILIRKDGLAKLADFGIATRRTSDGRNSDELARAGLISGTPQYISPEQITTPDQIDSRADMYSLGATLYHAASGHPPFERDSIDELLHAQLEDDPIPLVRVDPNIDPELSTIIERMLHKEPSERFRNMAEVRQRLEVVSSRIQSETQKRRRRSLSSSGISPVPPPIQSEHDDSQSERSPKPEHPNDNDSRHGTSKRRSSGNQAQLQQSGSLELRSPSRIPQVLLAIFSLLVIGTVIYFLGRSVH